MRTVYNMVGEMIVSTINAAGFPERFGAFYGESICIRKIEKR
jgi:hypothetical protein